VSRLILNVTHILNKLLLLVSLDPAGKYFIKNEYKPAVLYPLGYCKVNSHLEHIG